jgi:hypothetical protein
MVAGLRRASGQLPERAAAARKAGKPEIAAEWNRTLEARVADQLAEIERAQHLKRFLSPQVAELIAKGDTDTLKSHRRDIVAVGRLDHLVAIGNPHIQKRCRWLRRGPL